MLAIMEQREAAVGLHKDNTAFFLMLVIAKAVLDTMLFCFDNKKWYHSFLGLCSLSIAVMDWVTVSFMASTWFIGAERVSAASCFVLAHASATYAALPVPMMCFGVLDSYLDDSYIGRRRPKCKLLRNVVLMLVVWMQASIYSTVSVNSKLKEHQFTSRTEFLLCEVEDAQGLNYTVMLLFSAVLLAIWPFHSKVFQWVKEASRLTKEIEEENNQTSDFFNSNSCKKEQIYEKDDVQMTNQPRPPMWLSLTLAFAVTWMAYLTITVVSFLCDVTYPAYVAINNMWLMCIHSVLVGVVLWAQSGTTGPHSDLPANTCSWHAYWHLSRGTQPQKLPLGVFSPVKEEEYPFMCI